MNTTYRKVIFWIFVVFSLVLMVSLIQGFSDMLNSQNRVTELEEELVRLEEEQTTLETEISLGESIDFKEKEIRNKLFLSRDDEVIVEIPEELLEQTKVADELIASLDNGGEEEEINHQLQNWYRWLILFK